MIYQRPTKTGTKVKEARVHNDSERFLGRLGRGEGNLRCYSYLGVNRDGLRKSWKGRGLSPGIISRAV